MTRRKRYMLVSHPAHLDEVRDGVVPQLNIHPLLHEYHWSRLDDNTVVVTASYPVKHHDELMNHPEVTVLPSEVSAKSVKMHIGNKGHMKALAPHVEEHHTMPDLIETLEQRFGAVFALDR